MQHEAADDGGPDRVHHILERRRDAEVVAAAPDRPEQVGVGIRRLYSAVYVRRRGFAGTRTSSTMFTGCAPGASIGLSSSLALTSTSSRRAGGISGGGTVSLILAQRAAPSTLSILGCGVRLDYDRRADNDSNMGELGAYRPIEYQPLQKAGAHGFLAA